MKHLPLCLCALLAAPASAAELRLASAFVDHMVVQQDAPIPVWGWAAPCADVVVRFEGAEVRRVADADGRWRVELPAPSRTEDRFLAHTLEVASGDERLAVTDILVGEVWLASGQSNMHWEVEKLDEYAELQARGRVEGLRMFTVKERSLPEPADDVVGSWQVCDADTIGDFSAVGSYFGFELLEALDRPIGIVHSSWGGSRVEAWTSQPALLAVPAGMELLEDWWKGQLSADVDRLAYLQKKLTPEAAEGWQRCDLPLDFEELVPDMDGVIWFRREVRVPDSWRSGAAYLSLGKIDDDDEVWLDGVLLGATQDWQAYRRYPLAGAAAEALSDGLAMISLRVEDTGGWGGFSSEADAFALEAADGARLSIAEDWVWRRGAETESLQENHRPTHLYNGMVLPLAGLPLAGCIWYQGESNAHFPLAYRQLFPAMIEDWRALFGRSELPFYWVQLANYVPPEPEEGQTRPDWPALREAQRLTLDRQPHTGMAVIIDVGDADDIHPLDKHTVGARLARLALYGTYGCDVVPSGPLARTARRTPAGVEVGFETFGSELAVRGGGAELGGFELSGPDGEFHPAAARMDGTAVIVRAAEVTDPRELRYAWRDDPAAANLVNDEGLPASPFRLTVTRD